jgi:hypothetical protein
MTQYHHEFSQINLFIIINYSVIINKMMEPMTYLYIKMLVGINYYMNMVHMVNMMMYMVINKK